MKGYQIKVGFQHVDLEAVHHFISRSYWANNIPKSILKRGLENSINFSLFTNGGEQVGFARMITDRATFAYLADVYVLEEHRGKGLSKWLMSEISEHPELQGLRRIMLATRDAHGLYEQFGFSSPDQPEALMEIRNPNIYRDL